MNMAQRPPKKIIAIFAKPSTVMVDVQKRGSEGKAISEDKEIMVDHLRYVYNFSKTGGIYVSGALIPLLNAPTGFGLIMLSVNSLEDAKQFEGNDPFVKAGYYDLEEYYDCGVSFPLSKSTRLGELEKQLPDVGAEIEIEKAPIGKKIIVIIAKPSAEMGAVNDRRSKGEVTIMDKIVDDSHLRYVWDYSRRGKIFSSGGIGGVLNAKGRFGLIMLSVNSLEEAHKFEANDPYVQAGYYASEEYYEFSISFPLERSTRREALEKQLKDFGILK
jgi:uncharacterized protein YciI